MMFMGALGSKGIGAPLTIVSDKDRGFLIDGCGVDLFTGEESALRVVTFGVCRSGP